MYFQYGNRRFPNNEVIVSTFATHVNINPRGRRISTVATMSIEGVIILSNPTQSLLKQAIQNRQAWLSQTNRDAILYQDDGNKSAHWLDSSKSLGGVKVTNLAFPSGANAEYATMRTYTATFQAEYPITSEDNIIAFQETVSVRGTGGPRRVTIETLNSRPIKQTTGKWTKVSMSQNGSAVGYSSYPTLPTPLWFSDELLDARTVTRVGPKWNGQAFTEYQIQWSFSFEASSPSIGFPMAR